MGNRLLILLICLLAAAPLQAQYDSTTVFGRALIRRLDVMEKDPAFLAVSNGRGIDEHDWGEMDFATLDDRTLVSFFQMFATSIGRMTGEECLRAYASNGVEMIATMGNYATDSLEAEAWAGAFEAILWGFLVETPRGPAAPMEAMIALIGKMRNGMSQRLQLLAGSNEGRLCTLVPMVLRKLTEQEPAAAAPILRRFAIMSSDQ